MVIKMFVYKTSNFKPDSSKGPSKVPPKSDGKGVSTLLMIIRKTLQKITAVGIKIVNKSRISN